MIYFYQFLLSCFNMDYPVKLEDDFCTFLVVMYVCLNVKSLKRVCNFCTRISESIKNDAHHDGKQPHQEVEHTCILVKNSDAFRRWWLNL